MKKIKMIPFLFLSFFFFLSSPLALEVEIESENMVLYNLIDDILVASQNKDERTSIASMTKIMTALVAIEHIDDYEATLTLNYHVFDGLIEANASVAGFRTGQVVTYKDLLYGTLLASGADATAALALNLAGSNEIFIEWMNEKALSLGLTNTHFMNTSGLDEEGHYSTVNEIALLLKEALKNDIFKEIFTTDSYVTSDGTLILNGTLRSSLKRFGLTADYILGAKTGYTIDAGRCLASFAYDEAQDIYYLLVTSKAPITTGYYHLTDAINIYDYYFKNYGHQKMLKVGDPLVTLKTKSAKKEEVTIKATEDVLQYISKNYDRDLVTLTYEGEEVVSAFTKVGTKLGDLSISYNGEFLQKIPVLLDAKIEFSLWVFMMENIIWIILGILLIFCIYQLFSFKKTHTHKRKMKKIPKRTLKF